jgi:hypothetical protein
MSFFATEFGRFSAHLDPLAERSDLARFVEIELSKSMGFAQIRAKPQAVRQHCPIGSWI